MTEQTMKDVGMPVGSGTGGGFLPHASSMDGSNDSMVELTIIWRVIRRAPLAAGCTRFHQGELENYLWRDYHTYSCIYGSYLAIRRGR